MSEATKSIAPETDTMMFELARGEADSKKSSKKRASRDSKKNNQDDILHAGRLGRFSTLAADYTSSIDIDPKLLKSVVEINSAHVLMLHARGLIDGNQAAAILDALSKVPTNLPMDPILEDVHMNVESYVISKVGKQVGGMLNLAKSRNDQVATALRMVVREQLIYLGKSAVSLQKSLLSQAAMHSATAMPGYTHLQRGQLVTLGHELLAHFDSLDRDFERLVDCYMRTNLSPMGAGALSSTTFEIDRDMVARLLGFDSALENSLDAVSSRDFATETIYLCSQLMTDASRLAEEIILWTTKEFAFAEVKDDFASTSSMMPQKKNAIVPEIFRARTSQVVGDLIASLGILKSLPLSYNLDLQELTRNLWSALDKTIFSAEIFAKLVETMKFNDEAMYQAACSDEFLFSTDVADYLVAKYRMPFREAHQRVGELVRYCVPNSAEDRFTKVNQTALSKILGVEISRNEIVNLVDPEKALGGKKVFGSPNPKLVARAASKREAVVRKHLATLEALERGLEQYKNELSEACEKVVSRKKE
jgi:argininosuccinate lyase